jgi:ABC-type branched-subunit amino acid transport system substrate-binding protein
LPRTKGRPAQRVFTCFAALAVTAGLGITACSSGGSSSGSSSTLSKSPITIGVSAAETGYLSASSDVPFLRGLRYAVQSINSAGGVTGHPLKLSAVLDEQSVPATGVANVNQLINEDHVDVVMAGSDSTACASVESAINTAKVPMTCISPPPTGSAYQFQVAASVPGMVLDMMGYIKSLHITSVALVGVTTVYGEIIAKVIKAFAAKSGIKVVFTTTVPPTSTDLTATMQKVKAANPGAVVDSITGPEHVVEAKGAAAAGLTVPLIQITDTTDVFQAGAQAYPNLYFVTLPPQAYPSIPNQALATAAGKFWTFYKGEKADMAQIAAAAYGWDAVHILAAAMTKSGAFTGPKLQAAIQELTYQGTNSLYKYSASDHSGENTVPNPDSIGHFVNGKLTIVYNAS